MLIGGIQILITNTNGSLIVKNVYSTWGKLFDFRAVLHLSARYRQPEGNNLNMAFAGCVGSSMIFFVRLRALCTWDVWVCTWGWGGVPVRKRVYLCV